MDKERRLRSGNQAAVAGPRQCHEAPPPATAPQDEEGGMSMAPEHAHTCAKADTSALLPESGAPRAAACLQETEPSGFPERVREEAL
ncbi:hypothetical protein NDU88_005757 [Pleurodeles waltl]|uniref:Uncharacterized protein n=1 Tax=Pleurodeles waltl TaxID=8319 RepID=A0AAV7L3L3_PLEWA|nr:hypothetical protein NDU88_005757 [Pleurodeles waltl]